MCRCSRVDGRHGRTEESALSLDLRGWWTVGRVGQYRHLCSPLPSGPGSRGTRLAHLVARFDAAAAALAAELAQGRLADIPAAALPELTAVVHRSTDLGETCATLMTGAVHASGVLAVSGYVSTTTWLKAECRPLLGGAPEAGGCAGAPQWWQDPARTVLYVGRGLGTVPPRLRRALEARDEHRAFPGCRVHVDRTHAHHVRGREHGGDTSLANLVLLCDRPPPCPPRRWMGHHPPGRHQPGNDRVLGVRPT